MHQATTKYCNTCLAPGAHEPLAFCSSCAHISAHTHPPSCALSSNTNAPHLLLPPTRCCPPPVVAPHPPKKNARRRAKLNRNEPYYCAICEESLLTKGTKSLARTPFSCEGKRNTWVLHRQCTMGSLGSIGLILSCRVQMSVSKAPKGMNTCPMTWSSLPS